ncbi:hypothetical protein [uncultured Sphingomonas sp.]|uniref:hypothetical protein n=1 Tax=uncultured Sphingomonas sp. TaxID=158754 RepID=UPI0025EF0172|nr:hypothetical protein [uncultured Sphingomonas sp.]
MAYALIILLALVQSSAVEVWTGGDDGLTQRFANLFRTEADHIQVNEGRRRIRAVVEQIVPKRGGKVRIVINFERDGKHIGASRCTTSEDNLAGCIARAGAAAERFAANVR